MNDGMTRQEIINQLTELIMGRGAQQLTPNSVGLNATINIDGIRI